jgi:hypothetical protein
MSDSLRAFPNSSAHQSAGAQALSQSVVDAIKTLVSGLSSEDRARLLNEITEIIRPIPVPRAGEVLGMIVRLLPSQKTWTVEEFKRRVAEEGITAEPKEVYNAVSYLARKKYILRVGYGRYVVDGVEVVTSEDLGGASSRHEDGYRLDWTGRTDEESDS